MVRHPFQPGNSDRCDRLIPYPLLLPIDGSKLVRMARKHIVVVEDEIDILEVIEYNLVREGFKVSVAMDGRVGLKKIRKKKPDLVLLDLMLPGIDGLEICRLMKDNSKTSNIPIIIVTAKDDESDIVLGLGLGADDYVPKPFSPKELVARVKAVLRRSQASGLYDRSRSITCGPLYIDATTFRVELSGRSLDLTATEFRLLHVLASHPGRVFSRDELLVFSLGQQVVVLERNIDVHIRAIRKSMQDHSDLIETVRGVGYRFSENFQ